MNNFRTKSGLDLPLIDLKGKQYLQVAYRVFWWRTENPLGRIDTECVEKTDKYVVYKATISIPVEGAYVKLADAYKREDFAHFGDANEKASTGAIGRALALCGYGTQWTAFEFDEGERLADAPLERSVQNKAQPQAKAAPKTPAWTQDQKRLYCIERWGISEGKNLTAEQIATLSTVVSNTSFDEALNVVLMAGAARAVRQGDKYEEDTAR